MGFFILADLTSNIATTAGAPASVSTEAGSVQQQPIAAQIAADKYLKAAQAQANGAPFGLQIVGLNSPGAQ